MNADDTQYIRAKVVSNNLFSYCSNNYIMYSDKSGRSGMYIIFNGAIFHISDYQMTIQYYLHSIINKVGYEVYDFSDNSTYIKKIRESVDFKNFIDKFNIEGKIINMYHQCQYYTILNDNSIYNISFYNSCRDLYWSIGVCNVMITIKEISHVNIPIFNASLRNYIVIFRLYDTYDFEYWDKSKKDGITKIINNTFGYEFQKNNMLTPFCWYIDIPFMKMVYFS